MSRKSKTNFKRMGKKKPRVRGGLSGVAVAKRTRKRVKRSGQMDEETEQVTKKTKREQPNHC